MRLKHDKHGVSNVIVIMLSLVLIVIIVANVVLWSYQMNQLDWEKMQEDIDITDVTPIRDIWLYNPSDALGGSTSLLSGDVSNLVSDDSVYMIFRSYYSGNTTIQSIANMNFTSGAAGWVYGESNDVNNFASGAWSSTGGNCDPGCYDLMVDDPLATKSFDVEQWVNYTFTVDTIPSKAIIYVYASYRYTSDDDATGTPKIKLVRPDGIVVDVWIGSTVTLAAGSDTGHNYVSVDATSNFTMTGTYQLSLYTHTDSLTAADKATVHNYWDDAGITLAAPVYTAEVEFTGLSNIEDWNQLKLTVNSAWTIGSVNVTFQLHDYILGGYPTSGSGHMTYTSDSTPNTDENRSQTINVNTTHFRNATGHWKMKIKGVKATDTPFDFKADWIEFRAVNIGTVFTFENGGPLTSHLVSLWINNSTSHQRYDANIFINSGDMESYLRNDIMLPNKPYTVKVVTERGNTAVFTSH